MPVEQLWYTWSKKNIGGQGAGYGVCAASGRLSQLDSPDSRAMAAYFRYDLPRDMNMGAATPDDFPVCLSFLKTEVSGQKRRVLLNKRYVGIDGSYRPENYFIHVLYDLPDGFMARQAIRGWGSAIWRAYNRVSDQSEINEQLEQIRPEDIEGKVNERPQQASARPKPLEARDLQLPEHRAILERALPFVIQAYLRLLSLEEQRRAEAQKLPQAQVASQTGHPTQKPLKLYIVAKPEQVALLLLGLVESLPDKLLELLTFSTYEYEVEKSTALVVGTTWGTRPEEMSRGDYLPSGSYHSAAGPTLAINCFSPDVSRLEANPFAEAFANYAMKHVTGIATSHLGALVASAQQKPDVRDVASFLAWANFFTGRVDRTRLTPEELDLILTDPALAREYLGQDRPSWEAVHRTLCDRLGADADWQERAAGWLRAVATQTPQVPGLAGALVALGTSVAARAGQVPALLAPQVALRVVASLGPAAEALRGQGSQWPPEVQRLLVAASGVWRLALHPERVQFPARGVAQTLESFPSLFTRALAAELFLGDHGWWQARGAAILGELRPLAYQWPGVRLLLGSLWEEAARRLAEALVPGGQHAQVPLLVSVLAAVSPPQDDPALWHRVFEQQPQPTHLLWGVRAWLLGQWKLIPESFARDDLRAWLRVDWPDVGYLLSMGLPEAWEAQALQPLLLPQRVPLELFASFARQGYPDAVVLLAKLVKHAPRDPQVTEPLLQSANLSLEQARLFIEEHSQPLLDPRAQFLPQSFAQMVAAYFDGLTVHDLRRLEPGRYAPLTRLGQYIEGHTRGHEGRSDPLWQALDRLAQRAISVVAQELKQGVVGRLVGNQAAGTTTLLWLAALEIALKYTGQVPRWRELLQQAPQPRADVPSSVRLYLLGRWAAVQPQLDESVRPWLKIGWEQVQAVVEYNRPDAAGTRAFPDTWHIEMLTWVVRAQKEALSVGEAVVLEQHERQFGGLLGRMLARAEWRKQALDFLSYALDSPEYRGKAHLLAVLLEAAGADRALSGQVLKEAAGRLDKGEREAALEAYVQWLHGQRADWQFIMQVQAQFEALPLRKTALQRAVEGVRSRNPFAGRGESQQEQQAAAQPAAAAASGGATEAAPGQAAGQSHVLRPSHALESANEPVKTALPAGASAPAAQNAHPQPNEPPQHVPPPAPQPSAVQPPVSPSGGSFQGQEVVWHFVVPAGASALEATPAAPASPPPSPDYPPPPAPQQSYPPPPAYNQAMVPGFSPGPGPYSGQEPGSQLPPMPLAQPMFLAQPAPMPPAGAADNYGNQGVYNNLAGPAGGAPPSAPGQAVVFPSPTQVPPPSNRNPQGYIKDYLDGPSPNSNIIYLLAAAIRAMPREKRDTDLLGDVAKKLGKVVIAEHDLEQALVNLAPALTTTALVLLQECAREAVKQHKMEDRTAHLMAYVRLAVKYSYKETFGQPPQAQEAGITEVLKALKLTPARGKESDRDKERVRRLRMLQIIRDQYVYWPEQVLKDAWRSYEHKHFPPSQNPPPPQPK